MYWLLLFPLPTSQPPPRPGQEPIRLELHELAAVEPPERLYATWLQNAAAGR